MDRHVTAAALLDMYARDWRPDPFHTDFYALLDEARGQVPALVMGALDRPLHNASFAGEAVSYLPPEAVPAVVERMLAALADDARRQTALSVLSHLELEFPRLLHPHLARLFDPNEKTYYGAFPWRESGELDHPRLLRVLREGGRNAHHALECLLETRTPAAFAALARNTKLLKHGSQTSSLLEVGYEPVPGEADPGREAPRSLGARFRSFFARPPAPEPEPREWRRLYPEASYHLRFPGGYRDGLARPVSGLDRHPTWRLDAGDAPPRRFGGDGECVCGICGRPTQRLIELDPVPPGLGVTAVARLTLEMCVRCVEVNDAMEYVHDAEGRPSPHRNQMPGDEPEFESIPLMAAEVRLAPTPARWFWQDWGTSNDRQNLTRLGGHPAWVQTADYPHCPECGRFMTFLIQLDATLPAGVDETVQVFSEGVFYGFWCDRCRVSAFKWQIT